MYEEKVEDDHDDNEENTDDTVTGDAGGGADVDRSVHDDDGGVDLDVDDDGS